MKELSEETKIKIKTPMNLNQKPRRRFIKLVFLLMSYVVVAVVVWQITIQTQQSPEYQQQQAQKKIDILVVEKVRKLVLLPTGEVPQVAIIQDVEVLKKNQDFFIDAKNDDTVLVYTQARKAFLYRESENKIINIALNIGIENPSISTDQQVSTPITQEVTEATTTKR